MKIAITGPQGTGKSTLTKALGRDPLFKDYTIFDEITRKVKKMGLRINEDGDEITQLIINSEHLKNLHTHKFITDRCLIDSLAYTWYLYETGDSISMEVYDAIEHCTLKYIDRYDLIVYIEPEFELEDDGVRSIDIGFRDNMHELFNELIETYLKRVNIIKVTGTVEERVEQIKHAVNEYKSRTSS